MKRSVRILAVALALLMVTFVFASCGKTIKGTYEAEIDGGLLGKYTATYEFSGNKVTVTRKTTNLLQQVETKTYNGTYEITEDEAGNKDITITFTDESSEEAKEYGGTFDFSEGEENGKKYIKIGLIKYELED